MPASVCSRSEAGRIGADVSREGVQRDLLPLIEGTTVSTKHGAVKTDHVLFIASGAVHVSKPSDLLPELQGRLPIRVELQALTRDDFVRIVALYGFMENPSVADVLDLAIQQGVECDPQQATYFFGRETLVIGEKKGLATWRKYIFDFLFRNAYGAYLHLGVPPNRVIEIGQQVEI